jgi:transcriptional regulator with XRE-family HTH domain
MKGQEIGAAIHTFRLRRRQLNNGQPWTLEDLAVAMGDDKAHISRIERGQVLPNRQTVLRLARALELSRAEADYLLRLGGHALTCDPPDREAAAAATRWLMAMSWAYLHPVAIQSLDFHVWYANALWLRVAGLTPQMFRRCIQGQFLGSLRPRCVAARRLGERTVDSDQRRRLALARLRAAALEGMVSETQIAIVQASPELRDLWAEAGAAATTYSALAEQSRSEMIYPGRGILRFDVWWCPLQADRRFHVTHYLPHDPATREALREIRRDPRPTDIPECPVHAGATALTSPRGHPTAPPLPILGEGEPSGAPWAT